MFVKCDPADEKTLRTSHANYLRLMNRYFASMTFMPDAVAMVRYYGGTDDMESCQIMKTGQLLKTFRGMPVATHLLEKKDGSVVPSGKVPLVRWWLEHRDRRTFQQLGFYPDPAKALRFPRNFNTFGGLPFDRLPKPAALNMDLLQPVLDHVRLVLSNGVSDPVSPDAPSRDKTPFPVRLRRSVRPPLQATQPPVASASAWDFSRMPGSVGTLERARRCWRHIGSCD